MSYLSHKGSDCSNIFIGVCMMYNEYAFHRRARLGSIPVRGSRDFPLGNSENFWKNLLWLLFRFSSMTILLMFEFMEMILCIWLLTTLLVHSVISFAESRAGSVVVRTLIYSGVMLCLWFTKLLAKEGRVPLIYDVMVCIALCCVMLWDGDSEIWNLPGVMLCYGAIDGRATIFFCTFCMTYIFLK